MRKAYSFFFLSLSEHFAAASWIVGITGGLGCFFGLFLSQVFVAMDQIPLHLSNI